MRTGEADHSPVRAGDRYDSGWVGAEPSDDLEARLAAEPELFDADTPHILTALGPIAPGELGVTLVGSWNRRLVGVDDNPGMALHELEHLYAVGLRSLVDLGPTTTAQAVADLAWVSTRSPAHIIAGRSVGVRPPELDSGPRFGVATIGAPQDMHQVHRLARNVPLFVDGSAVEPREVTALLRQPLIEPTRTTVVIGALAAMADWKTVLAAGVRLALIAPGVRSDELSASAAAVRDLMALGYRDQLLLGYQDDAVSLLERYPIALMEAGLNSIDVRALLVDNPTHALTIAPAGRTVSAFPTD